MTSPRVVCLGEALIDLIAADGTGTQWRAVPGGAPYNAAIAAGRLGAPTSFLGVLSEDWFGELLRAHLHASHVDDTHCRITPEPTTLALAGVDDDGDGAASAFTFHVHGTTTLSGAANDLHLPADIGILHTSGSVALVLEPVASRLEGLIAAAQHRALIYVDANPRPRLIGRDRYLRRFGHWLGIADVLQLGVEDVAWMSPGADPVASARLWVRPEEEGQHAPGAVVLTRGAEGATVVRPDGVVDVDAQAVAVVDTIGAGDTFAGALLAALAAHEVNSRPALDRLEARWWHTAASYAAKAASIACTRPGSDPPFRGDL